MLIKPDRFPNDPWGWIGNQAGHFCAGLAGTFYAAVAGFMTNGEFPEKWLIWCVVAGVYLAFELLTQGWAGWDTVEDWTFAACYGSAAPLMAFCEILAGDPRVAANLMTILPWAIILKAHVIYGVLARQ